MTEGRIQGIQTELAQLRTAAQDLSDRADESWQAMHTARANGTPQGVTDGAVQEIVNRHYQQESAKLEQRRRFLEEQVNDLTNERRSYVTARQDVQKYLDEKAADYEKYCEAEKRAYAIRDLDPNDSRLREATRFAIGEFVGILNGYRTAQQQLNEYTARLNALGE